MLRAGRVSPDVYDTHCYDGWWTGSEGDFDQQMAEAADDAQRKRLPFTNTEYVENCSKQRAYRFLGPQLDALPPVELGRALDHLRGEIVAYESECLRRLGAQLIIHYMGICVRDWQDPEKMAPNSSFYALKNAFAPVGVTIDLFDRHFETGRSLTTPVHVMNGTGAAASGRLEVMILPAEPAFSWDGTPPADAVWKATIPAERLDVPAFGRRVLEVTWPMPQKEGQYVLAAVWRGDGQAPVHSRRVVFTIAPPKDKPLATRKIAVYDADGALTKWLERQGAAPVGLREAQVAVVGPHVHRSSAFTAAQADVRAFVEQGGTLVVLEQSKWIFDDLVKMDTPIIGARSGISTVFAKDRPDHPLWRGLPETLMRRWNGLPGTIVRWALKTGLKHEVLAVGTDRTEFPATEAAAEATIGKGRVIFCQFRILERLDRAALEFDPVAERLLVNLLSL